jgi:hypothetical protein
MGKALLALKDSKNKHQEFFGELNLATILSELSWIALISLKIFW